MAKTKWDWMAYTAVGIGQIAFIYEMVEIIRTENAKKFSWPFVLLGLVTSCLGLIYGFKNKLTPLIIMGIIDGILSIVLLSLKICYDKKCPD